MLDMPPEPIMLTSDPTQPFDETMDSTLFNKQTPKGVHFCLKNSEHETEDGDPYLSENTAQKSLLDRRSGPKCRFWRMEFLAG